MIKTIENTINDVVVVWRALRRFEGDIECYYSNLP
jgi:hypothetical protein